MFGVTVILILIFIALATLYLLVNKVNATDMWIIFISCLILLYTVLHTKGSVETFANDVLKSKPVLLEDVIKSYKKIDLEENIGAISSGLIMYNTAFNSKSYNKTGKVWYNISTNSQQSENCGAPETLNLNFEMAPVYSRKNGFFLSNNRIIGPYSNNIGIKFHSTFTVILAFKNGNLMVGNTNSEIELLKMYANSPNNNGLCLYIKNGSMVFQNNVQLGSLIFQYANKQPQTCLLGTKDTLMHLDKDILTFIYIVKDVDNVRILYMNEKSNIIQQLLRINISNDDITFSNKELVINRLLNWNANIYTFATYTKAMTDDEVTSFYNHVIAEHSKNSDAHYSGILDKYNATIDYLNNFSKCPFDANTCNACSTVSSWVDGTQIPLASSDCKRAIDVYCTTNSQQPWCKCWDKSSQLYNTNNCRVYRSLFGSKEKCYDNLDVDDIEYIKKKYKLLSLEECPKDIQEDPKMDKNVYQHYDIDKLKVRFDNDTGSVGCSKPEVNMEHTHAVKHSHPHSEPHTHAYTHNINKIPPPFDDVHVQPKPPKLIQDLEKKEVVVDPEIAKISLKKPVDTLPPPPPVPKDKVSSINDLYFKDPNIEVSKKKENVVSDNKDELIKNTHLYIGQGQQPVVVDSKEGGASPKNMFHSDKANNAESDSFFNKFLKVMLPQYAN